MDIQDIINSKWGAYFSIAIGRTFRPALGYRIGNTLARLMTVFKKSNLIKSIRSNQWVIHGENIGTQEQLRLARKVLGHAARCFYDLYHNLSDVEAIQNLVPMTPAIQDFLKITDDKQGMLVVAPHLSNFDLVVSALATYGFKAKILTLANPAGAYRVQNQIRSSSGLDITPLGDGKAYTDTIAHLKAGGVAATAVDRPVPHRKQKHNVTFFGRPSALPVGHISLALAAQVPITVVAAHMNSEGQYGLYHAGPITLQRHKNRILEVVKNTEMILEVIEEFIRRVPDQWLMYYPVWPQTWELMT